MKTWKKEIYLTLVTKYNRNVYFTSLESMWRFVKLVVELINKLSNNIIISSSCNIAKTINLDWRQNRVSFWLDWIVKIFVLLCCMFVFYILWIYDRQIKKSNYKLNCWFYDDVATVILKQLSYGNKYLFWLNAPHALLYLILKINQKVL